MTTIYLFPINFPNGGKKSVVQVLAITFQTMLKTRPTMKRIRAAHCSIGSQDLTLLKTGVCISALHCALQGTDYVVPVVQEEEADGEAGQGPT